MFAGIQDLKPSLFPPPLQEQEDFDDAPPEPPWARGYDYSVHDAADFFSSDFRTRQRNDDRRNHRYLFSTLSSLMCYGSPPRQPEDVVREAGVAAREKSRTRNVQRHKVPSTRRRNCTTCDVTDVCEDVSESDNDICDHGTDTFLLNRTFPRVQRHTTGAK